MAGTKAGGIKTAKTIREKFGDNFYKNIGAKGGRNTCGGMKGFALNPELAKIAGQKGGKISKRGNARNHEKVIYNINY